MALVDVWQEYTEEAFHADLMQPGERAPRARLLARPKWMAEGACVGADPALFFPVRGESTTDAKALCAGCPVLKECRAYAVEDPELVGVWGGTSPKERTAIRPPPAPKAEQWCSVCNACLVYTGGRCKTCYAYRRRTGRERPNAEERQIAANRRKLERRFEVEAWGPGGMPKTP